ncbi:hypothetical protein AALA69_07575 [Eggerthellaceae bacterium 24-137]
MASKAKNPTAPADVAAALPEGWNDDMELFESLVAMDAGDPRAIGPVMDKLAGEGAPAVRESLRGPDGIVRITACRQWVYDVIEAANAKNS